MTEARRPASDDIRDEYDFASMEDGVRGKYSQLLAENTNIVVLEDDVAAAFGSDEAVNEALRAVLKAVAVVGRGKTAASNQPLQPTSSVRP